MFIAIPIRALTVLAVNIAEVVNNRSIWQDANPDHVFLQCDSIIKVTLPIHELPEPGNHTRPGKLTNFGLLRSGSADENLLFFEQTFHQIIAGLHNPQS